MGGKYFLLANFAGFGNKGDVVEVVRTIGDLVMVKNGGKQFCVERNNLSLCQAFQRQGVPR